MIQEEYVTFETARLLKEAGFPQDIKQTLFYNKYGQDWHMADGYYGNGYAKPSQAQVMRWLRDNKQINLNIGFWLDYDEDGVQVDGRWKVDFRAMPFANPIHRIANIFIWSDLPYPETYEAAAEVGIQAACKYLIEMQEGGNNGM